MPNTLSDFPPSENTILAWYNHCDHQAKVPIETLPGTAAHRFAAEQFATLHSRIKTMQELPSITVLHT